MKTSMKVLAASIALAVSGAANAAMVTGAGGTNGELFLTVWDQAGAQSYHLDLGVTVADIYSNPTNTLNYDLSADANFAGFMGNTGLVYMVSAANTSFADPNTWGYLSTSNEGLTAVNSANAAGYFPINNAQARISSFAGELNAIDPGTAADTAGNYSAVATEGQAAYFGDGNWGVNMGGNGFTSHQSIDSSVAFYGIALPGGSTSVTEFNNVWTLTSTGSLTFDAGVSAVPVPAAVWLFGSGLLGLVGVARRRKA